MRRARTHGCVVDRRHAIRVAGAIALLGCILPGTAHAFTATAETVPGTIAFFGAADPRTTRELEQRLHVQAGPTAERLVLAVNLEDGQLAPGPLRIAGAGTLVALPQTSAASSTSVSGGRGGCDGPTTTTRVARFDLLLPANTSSTVSFSARVRLARATSDASVFVQRWELAPAPASGAPASSAALPGTVTISSRPVTFAGLRPAEVAIRVRVRGTGRIAGDGQRVVARSRRALAISGRVRGARAGDSVTIWRFSPGATTARALARVRVDERGRYEHSWRPIRRGTWDLYATYAGHAGALEASRSPCGGPRVLIIGSSRRGPRATPAGTKGVLRWMRSST